MGLTNANVNEFADSFNSSLSIDCRLYKYDILGSVAHAKMLEKQKIITPDECRDIVKGLDSILFDIEKQELKFDNNAEDIHSFIENELTNRIGDAGKKLHTARSRNDQVALDLRLFVKDQCLDDIAQLKKLIFAIMDKADAYKDCIMPGYTHLQRAQPINFGHALMAYAYMFERDINRLSQVWDRADVSPIGSCALAGTSYDTDRFFEASKLGFNNVCGNSIDGVSDRDFCLDYLSWASICMMHMSRFCEELILWNSWEFKFINLPDDYVTGSSIMPNKKNPDMAELVRGKTGRVYGDLTAMLTTMKSLPLAYNKDMQEDKEAVFDAGDTVSACLKIMTGMISGITVNAEIMKLAVQNGFINATDFADYLVDKGMPFRDAYKVSGQVVAYAQQNSKSLCELSLEEFRSYSNLCDQDVYE